MNYELAKQLQEAGFPQTWHYGEGDREDFIRKLEDQGLEDEIPGDRYFYSDPTLSELIEACGDKFYALIRNNEDLRWHVLRDRGDLGLEGLTPEEVVARLWLAIQSRTNESTTE